MNSNVWLAGLLDRRHPNVAAVALANKNVRTVWALLAHGRQFRANYVPHPSLHRRPAHKQGTDTGDQTTDCSGVHAVMARQVRPWLAKPTMSAAP